MSVVDLYRGMGTSTEKAYSQKGGVFKHPARVGIYGSSGSGKTNLCGNIILDHLDFDTLTIYARNPNQPIFDMLQRYVVGKAEREGLDPSDFFHISDEIDRDVKDFDQDLQNVVVFDDMADRNDKKLNSAISNFLRFGRPQNTSVIVITQNFHTTDKTVRENLNYFCGFRGRDDYDVMRIGRYYAPELKKEWDDVYLRGTEKRTGQGNDPNAFLFIDLDETDKGKKFRRAFQEGSLFPVEERRREERPRLKSKKTRREKEWNFLFDD